ncbi:LysR family transcriptional regulator [Kineococcus sp. SYSU DK006]|uniref:LysR family transcriptional regulator n=1 Tax=Kineococcus sp. SYSU DK006 TaxID=3383127 RepID=UPI003D7ECD87
MTPLQLRCALAVADGLHFTRAARELGIAQSALSHQVARLEEELGAPLFERTSRRVRLTDAGRALLPRARAVLAELDRLRTDVVAASGSVRGRLRIGTIPTLPDVPLHEVLAGLRRRHPGVQVAVSVLSSDVTLAAVAAGGLDVGFAGVALGTPLPGVEAQVLATEPHVAAVGPTHPWAQRRRVRLADLAAEACVDFPAGTGGRRQTDEAFTAARLTREVVVETDSVPLLLDLVRAGAGVALLPRSAVREAAGVHALAVTDGPARRTCVVHGGAGSSAATRAFLAELALRTPGGR